MTAASRSLATALRRARFASGLLPQSYTTRRDTTEQLCSCLLAAHGREWVGRSLAEALNPAANSECRP